MTASLYELRASFLPQGARVLGFEGEEGLNRLYAFRVTFAMPLSDALALDLDAATGGDAKFTINDRTGAPRIVYKGIVAALELLDDLATASVLRVHIVPKLWGLGLGEHSRVFVDKALPAILEETLNDGGLSGSDYELKLTGSYSPLPHVCQYRESRLAFITRWLERVGAYYFFRHGDGEGKLVITDSAGSHEPAIDAPVPYIGHVAKEAGREGFERFSAGNGAAPKGAKLRDYDELKPALAIRGEAIASSESPGGEVALFGVNEPNGGDAQAHAKKRADEYLSGSSSFRAHGSVFGLIPGFTFSLGEHPRDALNASYLVTEIRHRGAAVTGASPRLRALVPGDDLYRCELIAAEAKTHWSPPSTVHWPHVAGTVRGKIDGPASSEYAQIDKDGRYSARLFFDEANLPAGAASKRLRMVQPHAGAPEGFHFPLRKDTEVQISFLRGDPDQPVITGVLPNTTTASPVTEANKTQNVLQTGGETRLEMDDTTGAQYIDLSSPPEKTFLHLGAHAGLGTHNFALSTKGDYKMHTGKDRDITVGGTQTEKVTGDVTEIYRSTQTTKVAGSLTETIDGGLTQTVQAGFTQTINGGRTQKIADGETRTVTGGQTEAIVGGRNQSIVGASTETIKGAFEQTITGDATITSPAGHTVSATSSYLLNTPGKLTLSAGEGFNLHAPGGQTRLDDFAENHGQTYTAMAENILSFALFQIDLRLIFFETCALQVDMYGVKGTSGGMVMQGTLVYIGNDGVAAGFALRSKIHGGVIMRG